MLKMLVFFTEFRIYEQDNGIEGTAVVASLLKGVYGLGGPRPDCSGSRVGLGPVGAGWAGRPWEPLPSPAPTAPARPGYSGKRIGRPNQYPKAKPIYYLRDSPFLHENERKRIAG
jgi:hypothetical protein